jgi:hypothetical protein
MICDAIIGFVAAFVCFWLFRHLDNEDFFVHADDAAARFSPSDEESVDRKEKM